ncbi:MAG: hypothetical protein HQK54_08590 [Oligoflexales bacterium]|nr:hypothetical protein [Oligoflexales bacterium]
MELIKGDSLQKKIIDFLPELRPRPDSGRFWLDIIFLLFIVLLQQSILPRLIGSFLVIDLLTPWLVICFSRQGLSASLLLAVLAAFALETHTSVPKGLFFCIYFIILTAIHLIRGTLSWEHDITWIVAFGFSEFWCIAFESFVVYFKVGFDYFSLVYFVDQILKITVAIFFGININRWRHNIDLEALNIK